MPLFTMGRSPKWAGSSAWPIALLCGWMAQLVTAGQCITQIEVDCASLHTRAISGMSSTQAAARPSVPQAIIW